MRPSYELPRATVVAEPSLERDPAVVARTVLALLTGTLHAVRGVRSDGSPIGTPALDAMAADVLRREALALVRAGPCPADTAPSPRTWTEEAADPTWRVAWAEALLPRLPDDEQRVWRTRLAATLGHAVLAFRLGPSDVLAATSFVLRPVAIEQWSEIACVLALRFENAAGRRAELEQLLASRRSVTCVRARRLLVSPAVVSGRRRGGARGFGPETVTPDRVPDEDTFGLPVPIDCDDVPRHGLDEPARAQIQAAERGATVLAVRTNLDVPVHIARRDDGEPVERFRVVDVWLRMEDAPTSPLRASDVCGLPLPPSPDTRTARR